MLGNDCPKITFEIEGIIWEEILNVAKGMPTVHDAASNIIDRIPKIYDHLNDVTCGWFMLGMLYYLSWHILLKWIYNLAPMTKKEGVLNLSSFSVEMGTVSDDWPCNDILEIGDFFTQSCLLIENKSLKQGENVFFL